MSADYYDILGIGKDADAESIRRAYRREAKKFHPDSSGSAGSSERFRQVEEAYKTLGDQRRRQAYDRRESERGSFSIPINRNRAESSSRDEEVFAGDAAFTEPLLEVVLSVWEAARGVAVPLDLPVSAPCPECTGLGIWERMFCFTCGGSGRARGLRRMVLHIPPGVPSGGEFLIDTGTYPSAGIRVRVLVD